MNKYSNKITLVIFGVPMAKQSVRFTKKGFKYKDPKITQKENDIKSQIITQLPKGFKPFSNMVHVEWIKFVFPRPKKHYFTGKRKDILRPEAPHYKNTKPDLMDNLPKLLFDAMNDIVITDDRIIVSSGGSEKIFGDNPRIEVTLCELTQTNNENGSLL